MREPICHECGNPFVVTERWQLEHNLCPDCGELVMPADEEPDVLDLIESKKYAKRRDRDFRRALDETAEFN